MSRTNTMDAVLPLVLKDYDRFLILHTSLALFFQDLSTCWIIVPDKEWNELNNRIQKLTSHFDYKVVCETEIVSEFKSYRIPGWYKQQLIKLAMAEFIKSEFYITLDADLILTRKILYSDLIKNNRARCSLEPLETHKVWYRNTAYVLAIRRKKATSHNVTPTVFHRASVLKLHHYLYYLSLQKPKIYSLCRAVYYSVFFSFRYFQKGIHLLKPSLWKAHDWKTYLIRTLPWTESALYHTYMEELDHFDTYHYYGEPLYSQHSIWYKRQIKNWTPEKAFEPEEPAPFLVVQSHTHMVPQLLWEKLEKNLNSPSE